MSHPVIVREETGNGIQQFDVYSRLFEDRIIMLDSEFEPHMSSLICSQLLMLSNKSEEPITIYINSPGGSVISGLAIYDTMQMIPNVVETIAIGHACSMGFFLLTAGTKGHRFATPSARIMAHQVSSGARGTLADMEISLEETRKLNEYLYERIAKHCGITVKKLEESTQRDFWMSSKEAVKFGAIDAVLDKTSENAW